jgi:phosphoribosyl-AMP cyclohydrolase
LKVSVGGHDATCHTGRRSCFYRSVHMRDGTARLKDDGGEARFDPAAIYGRKA